MQTEQKLKLATKITITGLSVNALLSCFKFFAGLWGNSGAMVADAVHSLSDFVTDIVVLAGLRATERPADADHPYGHGKYETVVTAIIGGVLLAVGLGVMGNGIRKIGGILANEPVATPGKIALLAAILSMIIKEWLFHYTNKVGKQIESTAVIANAWHHRSDAISSAGAMLGIGGAVLLGEPWHILDPIAALIVSLIIIRAAVDIFSGSFKELVEQALDQEQQTEILNIVSQFTSISDPHNLRTRKIGSDIAIDLHIRVNPQMCVRDAHSITLLLEEAIRNRFGKATFISIHVEPQK